MIKLKLSEEELAREMLRATIEAAGAKINNNFRLIQNNIRQAINDQLKNSQEWQAIDGGELEELLEINSASLALNSIAARIAQSAEIRLTPFKIRGFSITGGIEIRIIKSDFTDILGIAPPEIIHNVEKDWLRWLLTEGDDIGIFNFDVDWSAESDTIGEAVEDFYSYYRATPKNNTLLRNNPTGERGVVTIPPEYQGTKSNNFITRAMAGIELKIADIFKEKI